MARDTQQNPDQASVGQKVAAVRASSLDEARLKAAHLLSVPPEQLVLTVTAQHSRGLFGLGGVELDVEARWSPPHVDAPVAIVAAGEARTTPSTAAIACRRGRISVTVRRPVPGEHPATPSTVDALVQGWPIGARDSDAIAQAIRAADGAPHVFAAIAPTVQPQADDAIAVHVSSDQMSAWLIPWADAELTEAGLSTSLEAASVSAGVDLAQLASLVGSRLSAPTVIARGRPVVNGVDAVVDFVVPRVSGNHAPVASDDATVDYREMGSTGKPVKSGEVVAQKTPVTEAVEGITVRGVAIQGTVAKDIDLHKFNGKGTQVTEDGLAIVAVASGSGSWIADRVCVLPLTTISGDVDFATGNVRVEGDVSISGTITTDFVVEATGNITVMGAIEGATVNAGGSVTINGGFVGQERGSITAGGSVTARFMEHATVHAGGPVVVGFEIRQCTVISETTVTVGGGRGSGRINGGLVRGKQSVEASEVGAENGVTTKVQAGWGKELDADLSEVRVPPRVTVRQTVHAGVHITVGGAIDHVTSNRAGGSWKDVDGKISIIPL